MERCRNAQARNATSWKLHAVLWKRPSVNTWTADHLRLLRQIAETPMQWPSVASAARRAGRPEPKMEETILKIARERMDSTTNGATNSHRQPSRRVETSDESQGSTLSRAITFMRRNGAATRKEILEGTEMAEGSFVHFMRDSGK